MDDKILPVVLKFILDKQSAEAVRSGALSLSDALSKNNEKLLREGSLLVDISEGLARRARELDVISRRSLIGGVGILGGLFAGANNFVKNTREQTAVTREWGAETRKVADAQERIWAVVAREGLPALKQAVSLVEKIAGFVEQNPGAVKLAVNLGTGLLAIAGLTKTLSILGTGIKLLADARLAVIATQQFLAGKLMADAANKQLAAAASMNTAVDLRKSLLGGGLGGTALAAAIAVPLGIALASVTAPLVNRLMGNAQIANQNLPARFTNFRPGAAPASGGSTALTGLRASPAEAQIVESYTRMLEEENAATARFAQERAKIVASAGQQEVAAARSNAAAIANINANYQRQLTSLAANFRNAEKQASQQYNNERMQIVRDGNLDIQRMEADHQEKMRKLEEEHNQRQLDAIDDRDAVALFREEQRYEKERKEAERELSVEIARRRQDLAIRLNDLAANFAAERAQRIAAFAAQMKEAAQQHADQLREQAARHREELRQIREAKNQQLQELNRAYREEQNQRRAAFIAQVRDLDASLLGERNLKQRYYQAMLSDAQAFLNAYRGSLPGGSGLGNVRGKAGSRDSGGYTGRGLYEMHDEFVLSPSTTRTMERMVGGQLTQANVTGAGGLVWNDYRTISDNVSAETRALWNQDTMDIIERVFNLRGSNR